MKKFSHTFIFITFLITLSVSSFARNKFYAKDSTKCKKWSIIVSISNSQIPKEVYRGWVNEAPKQYGIKEVFPKSYIGQFIYPFFPYKIKGNKNKIENVPFEASKLDEH